MTQYERMSMELDAMRARAEVAEDEVERLRGAVEWARENGPCTGFADCSWCAGIDAALASSPEVPG